MTLEISSPVQASALETVRRLAGELLQKRGLQEAPGPDESLRMVGLSSLDLVALVLALEDALDIVIPEEAMTAAALRSCTSLADLAASLRPA